ncbi:ethanolamine utilization protein EutJ [Bradyrhizobium sp. 31Argb]|uniref:ethanolamine utilization protein EutJ n=1 Tax=Bradyrhizobium sp. 31Argb TaxID=3141247 RepID=UPI0037499C01
MLARTTSSQVTASVEATAFLEAAATTFRSPACDSDATLSFGIDLGTATIVLTAVDRQGRPAYWDSLPCQAVRDGVVVNFGDAVAAVKQLKATATAALDREIAAAATAFPPAEARACRYVLENAGITCRQLVDEVTAAQALLQLTEGAIVDVGGGSTGVGVVMNGTIIALDDEPGGGYHLDLILAGALGISIEEAEERKRRGDHDYSHILRPGIERIASSIVRQIGEHPVQSIHLAGGAVRVPHAASIVTAFSGIKAWAYPHSELVTPFGIAMS